jgi:hypothetical protein
MARRRMSHTVDRAAVLAFAKGPQVAAELVALRSRAARETRRIAPKGPTGMYSESIVEGPVEQTAKGLATSYGSTDFAAHIVEVGSVNNPPYRPLHRAAQALGLRVGEA